MMRRLEEIFAPNGKEGKHRPPDWNPADRASSIWLK
jgi:hypothetical protein